MTCIACNAMHCNLDARTRTDTEQHRAIIAGHIDLLRQTMPNTHIIVVPEGGLSTASEEIERFIASEGARWGQFVQVLRAWPRSGRIDAGIHMNDRVKEEIWRDTSRVLRLHAVVMAAHIISVTEPLTENTQPANQFAEQTRLTSRTKHRDRAPKLCLRLKAQLMNYNVTIKRSTVIGKPDVHSLSGKHGGRQDDLAMAFQLAFMAERTHSALMRGR